MQSELDREWDREVLRPPPSALRTAVLSSALVIVIIAAVWAIWSVSTPAAPVSTPRNGARGATAVRLDAGSAQARQSNLKQQAAQPNPFVTAIRTAVGPQMSEVDLAELTRTVNLLICARSTTTAQAIENLRLRGLTPAVAEAVVAAVRTLDGCRDVG
jgi:hypothetical protein